MAERVVAKEWAAEVELTRRYGGVITYVLSTFGIRNRQDTEELTQDVLLAMFQNINRWLEDNPNKHTLASYIGVITRNCACNFLDYWNAAKRTMDVVSADVRLVDSYVVSREASPEVVAVLNDMVRKLSKRGSQRQRRIVFLHLVVEMSESEIVEELNLTRQAVNLYMHRMRLDAQRLIATKPYSRGNDSGR